MSKQLLIVNTDAVATTYAEMRAGKLGFIEENAIVAALTGAEAVLCVGENTTTPFKGAEVVDAAKISPDAGTAGVATFNFAGAVVDDPIYVKLINTTLGTMDVPMKNFEADSIALVAAAINAAGLDAGTSFFGFTATVATTIITVTAPINSTFRGAATDGVVTAYTVIALPSVGQAADITALETETLSSLGVTNQVGHPVVKPVSAVEAGATYIQYVYQIARQVPNKAGTGSQSVEQNKIILAVKVGLTATIAALDGDAIVE